MQHQYHNSLVLIVLLVIGSSVSKTADEIFVDELMRNYDAGETIVPGASVLVICNEKQIVRQSYGFAVIETGIETTPVTNFRLASLTKQFTAAAVLLLAEEQSERLQLDDLIRRKWLPTLPLATDAITIRHLLTHTSGLIDYEEVLVPDTDLNNQLHDSDVLDILTSQNRTYFSPAGSRYRYSNSGYALLALIVERASGKRFADFLYERIFLPLEMHGTIAFENGNSTVMHRAFGYSDISSSWTRTDQDQTSAVLGDGGIYSSIDDLLKWDAALYDNRLLNPESLRLMFTPVTMTDEPGVQYGIGWKITGDMIWHSGSTIGFRNVILRFPMRGLTVIVLTNRNHPEPYDMAITIAHHFFCRDQCADSFSCTTSTSHRESLSVVLLIVSVYLMYSS
ncbi:unnamed protein product [Rotaria magnacalcarata]|uniref:Beta-lactamase-related domain-containing protein n=1 Tax=Rotaria magnacalcarata TaxID=392030 RepID=A0A8S2RWJ9_9BILA|nr:unnamed protein product [Rotaria magnacalcarata]